MTFADPRTLPQYEQLPEEVQGYLANLHDALMTRTVLGQATGLLASQASLSTDEAWQLLIILSNLSNVKVPIVGQIVVDAHNGHHSSIDPTTIARVTSRLAEAAQRVRAKRPAQHSQSEPQTAPQSEPQSAPQEQPQH